LPYSIATIVNLINILRTEGDLMKNKFIFLLAILSFLLILGTSQVHAYLLVPGTPNPTNLENSGDGTAAAWLASLTGISQADIEADPKFMNEYTDDTWESFTGTWQYALLKFGNGEGGPKRVYGFADWAIINDGNPGLTIDVNGIKIDSYLDLGTIYLKTGVGDPGPLSHVRFYGTSSVPEPATMLLLGTGLIGLAAFGRRRFVKKG
jgi:hypothetical protein